MSKIFSLWSAICRFKYGVVLAIIVLIVGFADDNSYWNRHKRQLVLSQLSEEIANYKAQYEDDDKRLKELDENPIALEKLAREKYHMKRDNEDLFIVFDNSESKPAEADSLSAL
ncbi:MAG: septum formation initiator family protein [Bacteroidaceae bacterium]|nr:septum formation initiator family protein [Bacteroidaceae bacterium]